MAKLSEDSSSWVTSRGDLGVPAPIPVAISGDHAQPVALQEAEAEAGN
jgi:hypothetical protein